MSLFNNFKSYLNLCFVFVDSPAASGKKFLIFGRQVDKVRHQLTVDLVFNASKPLEPRISYRINVFVWRVLRPVAVGYRPPRIEPRFASSEDRPLGIKGLLSRCRNRNVRCKGSRRATGFALTLRGRPEGPGSP